MVGGNIVEKYAKRTFKEFASVVEPQMKSRDADNGEERKDEEKNSSDEESPELTMDINELHIALLAMYDKINDSLPCHVDIPSRKEVQELFNSIDKNQGGTIHEEEFLELVKKSPLSGNSWRDGLPMKALKAVLLQIAVIPVAISGIKTHLNRAGVDVKLPEAVLTAVVTAVFGFFFKGK
mmetsp:Transcript_24973/g.34421  ORF Transcript_24973/g.34421 Transcript_24973/m.34421 type:complete len:180 (+) Transcript_24973:82-621(+)|eukprot:CAMPEP_0196573382 /NCGR_PEP_ID=MMETSP1081-20130531/3288_1 /TAXON_ID=36882 /ORGANISM="Pyramimonas amylifera, Strain CCMP720" /LENGTH=179 /DNA_ID=CAMNT_0041891059 /DNA_START=82 /DNA_END=621 /DNA_ORIENTATION=+